MKKKRGNSENDELITKRYLKEEFVRFERRIDLRIDGIYKYIDFKLEPFEEMRHEFYSFKDQMMKNMDWLVGAFKRFEEEHMILTRRYGGINEKIDNHELRLKKLGR